MVSEISASPGDFLALSMPSLRQEANWFGCPCEETSALRAAVPPSLDIPGLGGANTEEY